MKWNSGPPAAKGGTSGLRCQPDAACRDVWLSTNGADSREWVGRVRRVRSNASGSSFLGGGGGWRPGRQVEGERRGGLGPCPVGGHQPDARSALEQVIGV